MSVFKAQPPTGSDAPVQLLLSRLEGVKRSGSGWSARCPAHDDAHNSLTVGEGQDGRAVVKCHTGCTLESILGAAGLSKADLFKRTVKKGNVIDMRKIVATYDYRDEAGQLLFQTLRYHPKDFSQRRPVGNGSGGGAWVYNLDGVERVLYRLPDLLGTPTTMPVFIVEGEKDADRLWDAGLPATTSPMGAGKWRGEYNRWLRGRNVIVLPDNDDGGQRHMAAVVHSLWGTALRIKVVNLPGLPAKGDVSDWLDAGHTAEELIELCARTPDLEEQEASGEPWEEPEAEEGTEGPRFTCMADVRAEAIDWLWPGFLARGKFGLWEGDPGIGKTFALLAAGTAITRGLPLPGMDEGTKPGNVMLLTMEDDLADTIRPRLDRLGADVGKFYAHDDMLQFDEAGLAALDAEMERLKPALLIIDPIMAYIPGRVDIYKPNQIRQITTPLRMLARKHNCAVVGIRHLTKAQKDRAIYRGSGGMDFVGASRLVVLVGMDPDNAGQRAIVQTKSNLGAPPLSVNFTLDGDGVFEWAGHSHVSAERILATPTDEDEQSALEEAMDFLRACLTPYPRKSRDVFREAEQNGVKIPTLRLAKRRLGIIASRHGQEGVKGGGVWLWSLPGTGVKMDVED